MKNETVGLIRASIKQDPPTREQVAELDAELAQLRAGTRRPAEWWTKRQAARYWEVHERTFHRWCRAGMVHGRKVGGRVRFLRSDVEGMFDENRVEGESMYDRRENGVGYA